jgi:major vault protein
VEVKLSYRVNFEGDDPEKWFAVENYVKFLCDHIRSKLKSIARKHKIEDLNSNATQIIRDAILGAPEEAKKRPGLLFEENNMRVYDVEVLDVSIKDVEISKLLQSEQYNAFKEAMNVAHRERELGNERRLLQVERELAQEASNTAVAKLTLQQDVEKLRLASVQELETLKAVNEQELESLRAENEKEMLAIRTAQKLAETEAAKQQSEAKLKLEEITQSIEEYQFAQRLDRDNRKNDVDVTRQKQAEELVSARQKREIENQISVIKAEAEAIVEKAGAVSPELVAALQAFGDKDLVAKVSESMAPLAILGGGSVVDVVSKMFQGTGLENILSEVKDRMGRK